MTEVNSCVLVFVAQVFTACTVDVSCKKQAKALLLYSSGYTVQHYKRCGS